MSDDDLEAALGTPTPPVTLEELHQTLINIEIELTSANAALHSISQGVYGISVAAVVLVLYYAGAFAALKAWLGW
jgi:hypothetical protein